MPSKPCCTYPDWVHGKITSITEEYQKGGGYGDIFEAEYLVYLECLIASRGIDPSKMWDDWRARIRELFDLKEEDAVLAMNRYLARDDRATLIEELTAFKRKWADGPTPRKSRIATEDVVAPKRALLNEDPPRLSTGRPEEKKRKPKPEKDERLFDLFGGS